ncbi:hypothetical protein [Niveibacterium sp.]|uniref:hypothetical protein n=1 Tax=Niveibacterium sp. TaxID=2017444 RepID=UPI0035B41CB1
MKEWLLCYVQSADEPEWDAVGECSEDLQHLQRLLQTAGYRANARDAAAAYQAYSSSLCAGWLGLAEVSDECLPGILLEHLRFLKYRFKLRPTTDHERAEQLSGNCQFCARYASK